MASPTRPFFNSPLWTDLRGDRGPGWGLSSQSVVGKMRMGLLDEVGPLLLETQSSQLDTGWKRGEEDCNTAARAALRKKDSAFILTEDLDSCLLMLLASQDHDKIRCASRLQCLES